MFSVAVLIVRCQHQSYLRR